VDTKNVLGARYPGCMDSALPQLLVGVPSGQQCVSTDIWVAHAWGRRGYGGMSVAGIFPRGCRPRATGPVGAHHADHDVTPLPHTIGSLADPDVAYRCLLRSGW
jgi:hypothetical protein